jgi:hypothetical protein
MVVVPSATPAVTVTGEPDDPTDAMVGLILLQVPPVVVSLNVVVPLGQSADAPPDIAAGVPATVTLKTCTELVQPVVLFVAVSVAAYTAAGAEPGTTKVIGEAGSVAFVTSENKAV